MKFEPEIYAFINFKQAAGFGHIGWGFRLSEEIYCYGSADHLWKHPWWDLPSWIAYMHVPEKGDIDWWSKKGTKESMITEMKSGKNHIRYHAYKALFPDEANPEKALAEIDSLELRGWSLLKHNCVHHAYLIFSCYGRHSSIPDPFGYPGNLIPRHWFDQLEGKSSFL